MLEMVSHGGWSGYGYVGKDCVEILLLCCDYVRVLLHGSVGRDHEEGLVCRSEEVRETFEQVSLSLAFSRYCSDPTILLA